MDQLPAFGRAYVIETDHVAEVGVEVVVEIEAGIEPEVGVGIGNGQELGVVIEVGVEAAAVAGAKAGAGAGCAPEVVAGQPRVKEEPEMTVAAETEHLSAAGKGNSSGTAADKDHIQDTADNIADTVVAVDTTVLKSA